MLFLRNFERFNNFHSYHRRVGGNQLPPISLLIATANDWPQHAASCHILPKLAAITIKVGTLLQDEGPWFFTLFSREEPPCLFCVLTGVLEEDERQSRRHEQKKCPFPSTRLDSVPPGYMVILLPFTPREQAHLASVRTKIQTLTHQLPPETQACITKHSISYLRGRDSPQCQGLPFQLAHYLREKALDRSGDQVGLKWRLD